MKFLFHILLISFGVSSCDDSKDGKGAHQTRNTPHAVNQDARNETQPTSGVVGSKTENGGGAGDAPKLGEWDSHTPQELSELLSKVNVGSSYENAQRALGMLSALMDKDATLGLAAAARMPDGFAMLADLRKLIDKVAKDAPQLVRAQAASFGNFEIGKSPKILHVLVDALAKADPGDAASLVAGIKSNDRVPLLITAFSRMSEIDPDAALKLAESNLSGSELNMICSSVVGAVSVKDLERAIEMTKKQKPGLALESFRQMIQFQIRSMKDGGVADVIDKAPDSMLAVLLATPMVVEQLVKSNPAMAVEKISAVPYTKGTQETFSRLALALATEGADKACQFIADLPAGSATQTIVGGVFGKLALQNCDAAIVSIKMVREDQRSYAWRGIAKEIAVTSMERALEIAKSTPLDCQADVYKEIGRATAYQSPANAVKILEDPVLSEKIGAKFRQEMLDNTVRTWAKQDLPAAQQWVEKLSETDAAKGYQGLMTTWMKADPVAASAWLSTQPLGPARDAGAQVLISQIKDTDPEMAEQWRKTLPPEQ
jgi:hypothetical protein